MTKSPIYFWGFASSSGSGHIRESWFKKALDSGVLRTGVLPYLPKHAATLLAIARRDPKVFEVQSLIYL